MSEAEQPSTGLDHPVPWTRTAMMMTAISVPLAVGTWSVQGFQAAAAFLVVMAATAIIAALFGRRSRAALILYSLAVVVVAISIFVVCFP